MTKDKKKKLYYNIEAGIFILIIAALLLLIGFTVFGKPLVTVSGLSMYPTFSDGELLSYRKDFTEADIQRSDVLVFLRPDKKIHLIKRVVGMPGDHVEIRSDGIYVNGERLRDDFPIPEDSGSFSDVTVPDHEFYVLGDNRNHSTDSRVFGTVPFSKIDYIVTGKSDLNDNPVVSILKDYFAIKAEEE